jgi:hypothetical protein
MISRSDAWGQSQMARRRRKQFFPGREGFVASPEDLILSKLYYREGESEKHLCEIAGNLLVSENEFDRGYIDQWAATLGIHRYLAGRPGPC